MEECPALLWAQHPLHRNEVLSLLIWALPQQTWRGSCQQRGSSLPQLPLAVAPFPVLISYQPPSLAKLNHTTQNLSFLPSSGPARFNTNSDQLWQSLSWFPTLDKNTLFCKGEQIKENRNWRRFCSSKKGAHLSQCLPMKQFLWEIQYNYGKCWLCIANDCWDNLASRKAEKAIRTKEEKSRKILWTSQASLGKISFPFPKAMIVTANQRETLKWQITAFIEEAPFFIPVYVYCNSSSHLEQGLFFSKMRIRTLAHFQEHWCPGYRCQVERSDNSPWKVFTLHAYHRTNDATRSVS